jgi:hypothetical protein
VFFAKKALRFDDLQFYRQKEVRGNTVKQNADSLMESDEPIIGTICSIVNCFRLHLPILAKMFIEMWRL